MRRLCILLAGLCLIAGTTLAESKFDFSGTQIQFQTNWYDTTLEDADYSDESNEETTAKLNVRYNIDKNTRIKLGFNTDDSKEMYDSKGELLFYKKDRDVSAQFDTNFSFGNASGKTSSGDSYDYIISEDIGSDKTYIKWAPDKDFYVMIQPYKMPLIAKGRIFRDGDSFGGIPGTTVYYKGVTVGAGVDRASDNDGHDRKNAIVTGVKLEYEFKAPNFKMEVKYGGMFFEKDENIEEHYYRGNCLGQKDGAKINWVTDSANVSLKYNPSKKLEIIGELGYVTLIKGFVGKRGYINDGKDNIESGYAAATRVSLKLNDRATSYVLGKYVTDGYLQDEEMEDYNRNINKVRTGGVTTVTTGIDFMLRNNLTVSGVASLYKAKEDIFSDKNSFATKISTKIKYKFK